MEGPVEAQLPAAEQRDALGCCQPLLTLAEFAKGARRTKQVAEAMGDDEPAQRFRDEIGRAEVVRILDRF